MQRRMVKIFVCSGRLCSFHRHTITTAHIRPPSHPISCFCFRSSNLSEIFRGGLSQSRYVTVKISVRNNQSIKTYLKIKG
jgi:hypothetical protein